MHGFTGWLLLALGIAFILNSRDTEDKDTTRALIFFVAVALFSFESLYGGQAKYYQWRWYFMLAVMDLGIFTCAYFIGGKASRYVMIFSATALFMDFLFGFLAAYYFASGIDWRLSGRIYFNATNLLEALEVASLLYFSGPVMRQTLKISGYVSRTLRAIKGRMGWTPILKAG